MDHAPIHQSKGTESAIIERVYRCISTILSWIESNWTILIQGKILDLEGNVDRIGNTIFKNSRSL
jgi:hypothetical protein